MTVFATFQKSQKRASNDPRHIRFVVRKTRLEKLSKIRERILDIVSSRFFHTTNLMCLESFEARFWLFLIESQNKPF